MIKLIVDNVFIEIFGASKECEFEIWNKLSFTIEEFGNPYPKTRHLYNRKTKKTYTGLLLHVIDILDERGEEYSIEDNRIAWEPNADYKLVEYVDDAKTIKLEPRPYQKQIIDGATNRECLQAATGAGKTFMMAALAAKFNVKPLAVFADKLTLVEQLKSEFEKFLGRPVGIVGGGKKQIEDITVYSIQSVTEEDVKDAKMIMIDECLTGDTMVTMWNGQQFTIQEIVENKLQMAVKTYNIEKKIFEPKYIYDYAKIPLKNKNKKMIKITIEGPDNTEYVIKCTEDHKIWVESEQKYIEAGKLKDDMNVILFEK